MEGKGKPRQQALLVPVLESQLLGRGKQRKAGCAKPWLHREFQDDLGKLDRLYLKKRNESQDVSSVVEGLPSACEGLV